MDTISSPPRQTQTRPDHVYSETQYSEGYPPGIEKHYWNRARNLCLVRHLRRAGVGPRDRILEVGCGTGVVVEHLVESGLDCRGVEAAAAPVIPSVRARVWAQTKVESLPQAERETFSVLLLLDVIEHWADPSPVLASLAQLFPNLRLLIVYVPARQELWSDHDEHFGHFRRYDPTLLADHLGRAGFRVMRSGYLFHSLYWAARALLARRGRRGKIILAPQGRAIRLHRWMASLLALESRVLPTGWRGSSAFAIARRGDG